MERNWKFDFLKGISCIIVVFLHCPLYGLLGDAVIYALRFSVPIFFMISGYYCSHKDIPYLWKHFLKILRIIVITEGCYMVWYLLRSYFFNEKGIWDALKECEFALHPVRTVLRGSFFNGTLWYLYAAMWTYILLIILQKVGILQKTHVILIISLVLMTVLVVGRYYIQTHYDINDYIYWLMNAVGFGLPLTLWGMVLGRFENKIVEKVKLWQALGITFLGFVMIVIEYFVSREYMDFHFSTLVIVTGFFMLSFVLKHEMPGILGPFVYIGRELSMYVYLVHFFFVALLGELAKLWKIDGNTLFEVIKPILVCILSILTAMVISKVRRICTTRRNTL